MNTIRLPALTRNGRPLAERLEWGSSDWAANSCLADWSQLEREWLGVEDRRRAKAAARSSRVKPLAAVMGAAVLLFAASSEGLRAVLLAALEVLLPVLESLAGLAPLIAIGFGLLVLAGVATGLWRQDDEPAPDSGDDEVQEGRPSGAG